MAKRSPKEPSQRQRRVNELLRHAMADIFMRGDLSDDDLRGAVITVTEVQASPDLKNARVFLVPLGGEKQETILAAVRRHGRFLRGELAHRVELKYVPELTFELDSTFDHSDRVDALLRSGKVARDLQ
jgi:ribosome-binding factor A